jgi:hypothetical protein
VFVFLLTAARCTFIISTIVVPGAGFDSVYGNVMEPSYMAYMVYDLRKSYPAYLVTYQQS